MLVVISLYLSRFLIRRSCAANDSSERAIVFNIWPSAVIFNLRLSSSTSSHRRSGERMKRPGREVGGAVGGGAAAGRGWRRRPAGLGFWISGVGVAPWPATLEGWPWAAVGGRRPYCFGVAGVRRSSPAIEGFRGRQTSRRRWRAWGGKARRRERRRPGSGGRRLGRVGAGASGSDEDPAAS